MKYRFLARAAGFLLSLALCLGTLCLILEGLGTGSSLMLILMRRHAPPETTGLPEDEYPAMCDMITGYLAGSVQTFQYTFSDEAGSTYVCFLPDEQLHMEDVKALFVLCRTVALIAFAAVLALLLALARWRRLRETLKGVRDGSLAVLMVMLALGLWGVMNFGSFFTAFHRLLFRNGLWIMDPRTQLLIRLMPADFFVNYAFIALSSFLPLCIALLAGSAAGLAAQAKKQRRQEQHERHIAL